MTRAEAIDVFDEFIDHFKQGIKKNEQSFDIEQAKRDIQAFEIATRSLEAWDEVKHECWDEGHNFAGEYQGVWVRFKDIERIMDKHLKEVEE